MKFLSLLKNRGPSCAVFGISFSPPKNMDNLMKFKEFLSNLQKMDYLMQFLEFHSLLQKNGLSNAISINSIPSSKTWTTICNFRNFFPFSINIEYLMPVSRIPFPSPKTWTVICNLWNFFLFSKNVNYHMQFLEFLSLLQKCSL